MIEEKCSYRFAGFLSVFLLVGLIFGGVAGAAGAALPQTPVPSRITAPIDNTVRVTVAKSTHPMARAQFDRGPVDGGVPMERMILVLRGSAEQDHQLRTLLDSQQTKGSADYHHWLTPQEFGQHFGPSQQDIQQVATWLQQQGFAIGSIAKSGMWIEFSGTAAQVNQAFHTQMRNFQVEGKLHTANNTDISIPAALAPVVQGMASLHDFYSKPMLRRSLQHPTGSITRSKTGVPSVTFTDGTHGVGPADFATIYSLNPLYQGGNTGSKETIAIVAVSNINTIATTGVDDVANFRSLFGLPAKSPNIILNGPDPGIIPGAADEATIDTEWSGAVAPGATIDLVVSGGTLTTDPILLSSVFIVENNLAPIMSVSFGACEQVIGNENTLLAILWQQAAAQGISVFVSSGDTGAAGCDPNGGNTTVAQGGLAVSGFASTPFNTAVGGTEFNETVNGGTAATFWNAVNNPTTGESAIGYIPEKVWNDSCIPSQTGTVCQQGNFISLASGSGGASTLYSPPSWQSLNITGLSGANFKSRVLPDISLTAANEHDPLIFCFSQQGVTDCQGTVSLAGGTSFSSPAFAGIMALVDQNLGPQGLANYVLYSLGAKESAQTNGFTPCNSSSQTNPVAPGAFANCVFADTTAGNNGVPGNDVTNDPTAGALGFPAVTGYDLATGLGSVNANNLVTQWGKVSFAGSTTTLTASFNNTPLPSSSVTITHGQAVAITMNVAAMVGTNPPTGNVALGQGGSPNPQPFTFGVVGAVLSPTTPAGTATTNTFNVTNLPGGSYSIFASYPGDGNFGSSTSSGIAVKVNPEGSTTTLQSNVVNLNTGTFSAGTTVAYGDPVNILVIDADAVGGSGQVPAAGPVTFTDNNAQIAQIVVDNSGISELASCFSPLTACLTPGKHTIVGTYGGDGTSFSASGASAAVNIMVTPGSATPIVSGPSQVNTGQQVTIQALVQPFGLATIIPTGSVTFFDGATALGGAVTLSNTGTASTTATFNSSGVHSITAKYTGDSTYNANAGAALPINVGAPFNFAAATSSQTIAAGGTATFNVTLSSVGGFTGAVNFNCTGATGGATCAVSPNPANLTASTTSIPVTVTVSNTMNTRIAPRPFRTLPWVFAAAFAISLWGVRKKPRQTLFLVLAAALIAGAGSCGGGGNNGGNHPPPTVDTLVVTGTSGTATNTVSLTLTVTH